MFSSLFLYFTLMKVAFFFSLVRIQIKFDTMTDHWLFLGVLYTAAVAFLSWIFVMAPGLSTFTSQQWQMGLLVVFVMSTVYFRLMAKFVEGGLMFWILLVLGIPLALY